MRLYEKWHHLLVHVFNSQPTIAERLDKAFTHIVAQDVGHLSSVDQVIASCTCARVRVACRGLRVPQMAHFSDYLLNKRFGARSTEDLQVRATAHAGCARATLR